MRKALKWLPLCLLASTVAFAQGAYYQNNAFTATYLNGTHVVTVIDGAQVEVCTTVTGSCTQVPVYSDQAMTHQISQPFAVDGGGNFGFYVAPGTYSYWVLDSVGTPMIQLPFTTGGGGGSGSGITGLVGDGTASGSGVVAFTLATVNSSPGSCGDATHVCQITTNGKGLTTSQTAVSISTGSAGVSSLNSLTGAVNITAGANIAVTPSGSSIAIASTAPAALSGQTANYLPKANTATTSIGPSIISDDGTNATVHGGVIASNVTDSALAAGNCVQTAAGGLLGSAGIACFNPASPTFTGTVTFNTGVPTLSACTGGALTGTSSNNAFHITGLTGTACTVTFSAALAHGVCTANAYDGSTPQTVIPAATTSAVTFTIPSGTTDITAICF